MAARASVDAMGSDGSDRVHVVTGCGFGEVYGSAPARRASLRTGVPASSRDGGAVQRPDTEGDGMDTWIRGSRSIVMVIGIGALLLAGGNVLTGGASITDPVMPGGMVLGLLAIGAGMWTTDGGSLRALVVWLGVAGILVALAVAWTNLGDMQTRDLLLYVGIPTLVVLTAAGGVAVGRARSGALGGSTLA
jgi:hypothetical protein